MPTDSKNKPGALASFDFDDEQGFFDIPADDDESPTTKTLKEIKGDRMGKTQEASTGIKDVQTDEPDDDDDEDNDKATSFGDWEEAAGKPKKKEEVKKVKTVPKKVEKEIEEPEEEEENFADKDETSADTREEDEEDDYSEIADDLKEVLTIKLKEGQPLTRDAFIESVETEIEGRVDEVLTSFFEESDEETKEFIRFKRAGGSVQDFIAVRGNTLGIDELDPDNDRQVAAVISHYIKTVEQETDEDVISDRIAYLKDGGKDKATAKKYFDKIKAHENKIKKEILEAQEDLQKEKVEATKSFYSSLKTAIKDAEEVGSFTLSREDRKKLDDFLIKPTVKVGKNNYIQPLQASLSKILNAKTKEDQEKLLQLGLILMNDFNMEALTIKTETKVVKKVKEVIEKGKKGIKARSAATGAVRNFADYFD